VGTGPDQYTRWQQLTLDEPPVVEMLVRVGYSRRTGVLQFQVESFDATEERRLSLWSLPGRDPQAWPKDLATCVQELTQLLEYHIDPFS